MLKSLKWIWWVGWDWISERTYPMSSANNPVWSQFRHLFCMVYEPGQESLHVAHLRPRLVRIHVSLCLDNPCPSLNIAVYVAGKAVTRLRDCSALTIARHLSSVEEVYSPVLCYKILIFALFTYFILVKYKPQYEKNQSEMTPPSL